MVSQVGGYHGYTDSDSPRMGAGVHGFRKWPSGDGLPASRYLDVRLPTCPDNEEGIWDGPYAWTWHVDLEVGATRLSLYGGEL